MRMTIFRNMFFNERKFAPAYALRAYINDFGFFLNCASTTRKSSGKMK